MDVWKGGGETWLRKAHRNTLGAFFSLRTFESTFLIGVLTPLLPCGLLYAMFVKAAESGTPAMGAITMFAFGTGIVPTLVVTGLVSAYVGLKLPSIANRIAALTIILMGTAILMRGAGVPLPFIGGEHEGHQGAHPVHHMESHLQNGAGERRASSGPGVKPERAGASSITPSGSPCVPAMR